MVFRHSYPDWMQLKKLLIFLLMVTIQVMDHFKEISIDDGLEINPFQMVGSDWMLITAEDNGKINTMTASWGGLGVMWGKNVVYTVIRPQRYTKEFVDHGRLFSLSFFGGKFKKELSYLGRVSGRDEDKISECGLKTFSVDGVPAFEDAETIVICKKLFAQPFLEESFLDRAIISEWYSRRDYHTMYVAEIVKYLVRQ